MKVQIMPVRSTYRAKQNYRDHPARCIGMTLLWLLADSNELKAFRSVSGDRWLYLAVIAIDLWPINSRTVNKSVPSATNHEANEWRHV
jgi:hypothetical protein